MTGAELLLRFVPGPLINLWRLIRQRPYPDVRIIELKSTGGSTGRVDFSAYVANYGTQQCRAEFSAYVKKEQVTCVPATLDLVPNTPPQRVAIVVPRPSLGELVPALNHATTLHGETLRFEAAIGGKRRASKEWTESVR